MVPTEEEAAAATSRSILELLPCTILIDILSRLPLKTIFHCRCVCKTWLHLLLSPDFTKAHLPRSPSSLLLQYPSTECKEGQPNDLFLLNQRATDVRHANAKMKFNLNLNSFNLCYYELVDSHNGLLCLSVIVRAYPVYILNPLTGDYISLPQTQKRPTEYCSYCRFGFCPKTNQYKVVRFIPLFLTSVTLVWEVDIYTLGLDTASWRSIGSAPEKTASWTLCVFCSPCEQGNDCFLNGILHWVVNHDDSSKFLYSFDYTNETFQPVPPPLQFGLNHKERRRYMTLGVFDDCLCICDYPSADHYDIWVMKEYEVQESWSKLFVIEGPLAQARNPIWLRDFYLPMKFLNHGEILMLRNGTTLVSYSLGKRCFENHEICGIPAHFQAFFHIPSFVSFKDIAMGENLKVLNVRTR